MNTSKYKSFSKIDLHPKHLAWKRWLIGLFIILVIVLFLPWTQNIQTTGKVTTLKPSQRPQTIHATIAGRVEKWYVNEGQMVKKGDTIVFLSEVKTDYFDPQLLDRTNQQINAKENAVNSYNGKAGALENQITATRSEYNFKKEQLQNKLTQEKLKLTNAENEQKATEVETEIAERQWIRTKELYEKGIKPLTEVEDKKVKFQNMQAKIVLAQNKIDAAKNEIANAELQLSTVLNEYQGKISKTESEKFSTLSDRFEAEGNVSKLKIQYENYRQRNSFYYITAPQDCYVINILTTGIGETVKEGQAIISILPADYELATEIFVEPIDLPLIADRREDAEIRFIFDGWPAFVFSGWPNQSFGTYSGKVFAIDNIADEKGKYRVLVQPNPTKQAWPTFLRPGSGAKSFVLLNNVPVWYEIWRQLSGFPPDFYQKNNKKEEKKK